MSADQMTLDDWRASKAARADEAKRRGIARVEERDGETLRWIDRALDLVHACPLTEGTGEDLRIWVEARIGPPHHPNATGAFVRRLRSAGMLVPTGEWRKPVSEASHSRPIQVYAFRWEGGAA